MNEAVEDTSSTGRGRGAAVRGRGRGRHADRESVGKPKKLTAENWWIYKKAKKAEKKQQTK